MDEVFTRRVVGIVVLALAAFLLSWLLPRPGLRGLQEPGQRLITVDLTRPDSVPVEQLEPDPPAAPAPPAMADPPPVPVRSPPSTAVAASGDAPAPAPLTPAPAPALKPVEIKPAVPAPVPAATPVKPVAPEPVAPKPAAPKPVAPKPAAPKTVVDPAAGAAGAAGAGGSWLVQAGAFSLIGGAQNVVANATLLGLDCVVSPGETPRGTLYRVRCGPYPTRAQADNAVARLNGASLKAQVVKAGG